MASNKDPPTPLLLPPWRTIQPYSSEESPPPKKKSLNPQLEQKKDGTESGNLVCPPCGASTNCSFEAFEVRGTGSGFWLAFKSAWSLLLTLKKRLVITQNSGVISPFLKGHGDSRWELFDVSLCRGWVSKPQTPELGTKTNFEKLH